MTGSTMPGGRLSPDELAYHRAALGDLQAAQAAWRSWLGHLARKYGLGEGDTIAVDGALAPGDRRGRLTMAADQIDQTSGGIYFVSGTLTTSATALGASTQDLTELVIQADPDNAVNIVIGDASSQGWKLAPGDQFNCPVRNPGLIWGKSASSTAAYSLFGRKGA